MVPNHESISTVPVYLIKRGRFPVGTNARTHSTTKSKSSDKVISLLSAAHGLYHSIRCNILQKFWEHYIIQNMVLLPSGRVSRLIDVFFFGACLAKNMWLGWLLTFRKQTIISRNIYFLCFVFSQLTLNFSIISKQKKNYMLYSNMYQYFIWYF